MSDQVHIRKKCAAKSARPAARQAIAAGAGAEVAQLRVQPGARRQGNFRESVEAAPGGSLMPAIPSVEERRWSFRSSHERGDQCPPPGLGASSGVSINDDPALEAEADVMGSRASRLSPISAAPAATLSPSSSRTVQRIEIVREMQANDGTREEVVQHQDIDFDTITPDQARGYLTDVAQGKARYSNEQERQQLRDVVQAGRLVPLLDEQQMIEAMDQGVIVRFHQNGETLQQEVDAGQLSGHKIAVYDIAGLIKGIAADDRIPGDEPNAAVLNFQEGLRTVAETAVRMLNRTAVIATSDRSDDDSPNKLITWANAATYISDVHATVPLNPRIVRTNLPIDTGAQLQAAVTEVTNQLIDYIASLLPGAAQAQAVQGEEGQALNLGDVAADDAEGAEGAEGGEGADEEELDPQLHVLHPELYHPNGRARMVNGYPQDEHGNLDLT